MADSTGEPVPATFPSGVPAPASSVRLSREEFVARLTRTAFYGDADACAELAHVHACDCTDEDCRGWTWLPADMTTYVWFLRGAAARARRCREAHMT